MARKDGSSQRTLATGGFDVMRKTTRRHEFLRMMNRVMPWQGLVKLVEPFYPKSDQPGRPVKPLIWMLKLYFLQIWYGLSDPRTEELMHDSHAVQEFLGLDLGKDAPPDGALCVVPISRDGLKLGRAWKGPSPQDVRKRGGFSRVGAIFHDFSTKPANKRGMGA